jgi:hypothetical protein
MDELSPIEVHTQSRVMGISVDPRVNRMFSISESGYLTVNDLNSERVGVKLICNIPLCISTGLKGGLKALVHDIDRDILFIAGGSGEIFIYNSIPLEPELITTVYTDKRVCIRGLTRSVTTN